MNSVRVLMLLSVLTGSGCGTTPLLPQIPPSRETPTEEMMPCPLTCKIRPEATDLSLEDQLALVRGCHEADMHAYAICSARQHKLAEWIESTD